MRITLNGESKEVVPDLSVGTLLQQLELQPDRVAVEINLSILDRSMFPTRKIQEGDRIEIISFIGGGSPGTHIH
ncbi:MAG: sulfur carrier protein ThiS [Nitrospirales bacterium]